MWYESYEIYDNRIAAKQKEHSFKARITFGTFANVDMRLAKVIQRLQDERMLLRKCQDFDGLQRFDRRTANLSEYPDERHFQAYPYRQETEGWTGLNNSF